MKRLLLWGFIIFALCSCDNGNDLMQVTMKDGYTIVVDPSPKYYADEDEFVHAVSFYFPRPYDFSQTEEVEYTKNTEKNVKGYNQFFIGHWETARFGEWIRSHGLDPRKTYYVATKVYAKYVSMPPEGLRIVPEVGGQFTGYLPCIEPRTFQVENNCDAQAIALITGFRYIGYDSERNATNYEMPSFINNSKTNLIWKLLIRDDGWD